MRPDYADAFVNRGVTLHELKRFDEALASYDRAIALRPDYAQAHFNEAVCRMLIGDFDRGWQKFEWGWETEELKNAKRTFSQPLWLGSDEIAGKTVLLHGVHGFGDTIQFCRYVPHVVERGARVILEIQEPLRALMGTLPGAAQIVSRGEPLPDFDSALPVAQPAAGARNPARDHTRANTLSAGVAPGGDGLERPVGPASSTQDRPRLVRPAGAR